LTNATWANRLQIVLAWIGFSYFAVCGVLIALYLIAAMFKSNAGNWGLTLLLAVAVCLSGVPFYFLARKRKGNAEKQ